MNEEGKILVLVQPGYFMRSEQIGLQQNNTSLEARVASLEQAQGMMQPQTLLLLGVVFVAGIVLGRRRT